MPVSLRALVDVNRRANPIRLHELQEVIVAVGLQDLRDVRIGAVWVAIGLVSPVTIVGPPHRQQPAVIFAAYNLHDARLPKSMDGPAINGSSDTRGRIPELRLQQQASRTCETARIVDCGRIVAALW